MKSWWIVPCLCLLVASSCLRNNNGNTPLQDNWVQDLADVGTSDVAVLPDSVANNDAAPIDLTADYTAPEPEATAIGEPAGFPVEATIGAAGGEVASADTRFTVTFPEGALVADQPITLTPITNLAQQGIGLAYLMEPEDVTFEKPVTVTIKVSDDEASNSGLGGLNVAYQDSEGFWQVVPNPVVDAAAKTISVSVTHFCSYSLVPGYILDPTSAKVNVGGAIAITLRRCFLPMGRLCKCFPEEPGWGGQLTQWEVNGVPGGNATFGQIQSNPGSTAVGYDAPSKIPDPATVAVSVHLTGEGAEGGSTILVSNVTLVDDKSLVGWFDLTYSGSPYTDQAFLAKADAVLVFMDDGIDETNYEIMGNITMKTTVFISDDSTCTLSGPAKKEIVNQSYFKVLKQPAKAVRWSFSESWNYTCYTPEGATWEVPVMVQFMTGTGMGCTTFADVPIDDTGAPEGSYTSSCSGLGSVTAEWSFYKPSKPPATN